MAVLVSDVRSQRWGTLTRTKASPLGGLLVPQVRDDAQSQAIGHDIGAGAARLW